MIKQVTDSLFEIHDEQGVAIEQFRFKHKPITPTLKQHIHKMMDDKFKFEHRAVGPHIRQTYLGPAPRGIPVAEINGRIIKVQP